METVNGKVVLVTGAAMGMGKMYAERAVAEGARAVVLWDVDETALKSTAEALRNDKTTVHSDRVDVGDRAQVAAAAQRARDAVGDPQVVFNNAGIVRGNAYFWETKDVSEAELTMKVNALGPMFVAHEFLPAMVESGEECRLVNVASAAGLTANPRMAAYASSKWAAVGWSESVRLELEQAAVEHVKVTTVCPYYVKTGMFEGASSAFLLPLLEPEDVVDKVWHAMKKGEPMVVMPKTAILSETIRGVLPIGLRDRAARLFGVHKSMEAFTGRPAAEESETR